MNRFPLASTLLCLSLGVVSASAQGKPGGPPPGAHGPGGPGGPGNPGGPGGSTSPAGSAGSASTSASAGVSSQSRTVQHFGPVGRWWDDKAVVQAIGLSHQQQRKMDEIFNANKPSILNAYKSFLAEQAKLDAVSKQTQVDQTRMFAAIDSVNEARASLEKANTQMLLQIRQQMDVAQVGKLEKLQ